MWLASSKVLGPRQRRGPLGYSDPASGVLSGTRVLAEPGPSQGDGGLQAALQSGL